jgi:hypothetical protein
MKERKKKGKKEEKNREIGQTNKTSNFTVEVQSDRQI